MPDESPTSPPSVPIGRTTVAGYSVGGAGFVLALIAFMSGDGSQPTVEAIAAGAVAAASYLVTQIGRYVQARELARKPAIVVLSPTCPLVPGNGGGASGETSQSEALSALVERVLSGGRER